MDQIAFALKTAETRLKLAIPNPELWAGAASIACAENIENLAEELHRLQLRLDDWAF